MRRRFAVLMLLLALLTLFGAAGAAMAADPLVPERPATAPAYPTDLVPLYDNPRYEIWNYTFEGDRFGYADYTSYFMLMNEFLVAKAWLMKMAIRSVEYTLTQDWFTPFADKAGEATSAMGRLLWQRDRAPLVVGALSLTALWALLLYLRGRITSVWASLGGTVLILALVSALLAAGSGWTTSLASLARALTVQTYGAMEQVSPGYDPAYPLAVRAGDYGWNTLVYQPWLQGEFGTKDGPTYFRSNDDNIAGGRMLRVTQDYRLQWFRECQFGQESTQLRYCAWWRYEYLPRRMALAVLTFLATLLYAGPLLALSAGIMLAQLALLFFLALAPVWLMVALWWPEGGVRLLRQYLFRVLGVLVSQAVLAATLGLLLVLSLMVKSAFLEASWMLQSMLLAALGVLAFRFRYAWLAPFPVSRRSNEGESGGLWERIRVWVAPGRRTQPALPVAAGAVVQPVPLFSTIMAPPLAVQQVAIEVQRPSEAVQQPARPAPSQREVVTTQMRLLREQLTLREELVRREQAERQAAGSGWEEPTPSPGRKSNGKSGGRSGDDLPSAGQIPAQRPRS